MRQPRASHAGEHAAEAMQGGEPAAGAAPTFGMTSRPVPFTSLEVSTCKCTARRGSRQAAPGGARRSHGRRRRFLAAAALGGAGQANTPRAGAATATRSELDPLVRLARRAEGPQRDDELEERLPAGAPQPPGPTFSKSSVPPIFLMDSCTSRPVGGRGAALFGSTLAARVPRFSIVKGDTPGVDRIAGHGTGTPGRAQQASSCHNPCSPISLGHAHRSQRCTQFQQIGRCTQG